MITNRERLNGNSHLKTDEGDFEKVSEVKFLGALITEALEWNPQGTRAVGRPRGTWRRSVREEIESTGRVWNEFKVVAANRVRWRALLDVLCSTRE